MVWWLGLLNLCLNLWKKHHKRMYHDYHGSNSEMMLVWWVIRLYTWFSEFLFAILSTDIQQRCVFHQKPWILPTSMWILKSEMWIQATNMWIETTTMWNDVDLSQFWKKDWRNAGAFTFPKWDFVSNKVYENPIRCGSAQCQLWIFINPI